jgi:hypothetical protein
MYFFIELPNGTHIGFDLPIDTTISDVKKKCWERLAIKSDWESWNHLVYLSTLVGRTCTDTQTLADIGVSHESTLRLNVRVLSCTECD